MLGRQSEIKLVAALADWLPALDAFACVSCRCTIQDDDFVVCRAVDFGADQDVEASLFTQRVHNAAGAGPAFCSEY